MPVINYTRGVRLADNAEIAGSWFSRLKGLMFREELPAGQSLVLSPCNSIHTCFMKFNIDVLFLNKTGKVIYMLQDIPPFRFSPLVRGAGLVIELPARTISSTGTSLEDLVSVIPE